jgi:uncharacterized spore protein YtfJ
METTELMRVMAFALAGWLATSYRIVHSRITPTWRRRLIIPLWFVWMGFGLGGPVFTGSLSVGSAISTAASFTAGMMIYLFLAALQRRSRSR